LICSRLSVLKKRSIPVFDQKKNNDSVLYKNVALEKAIKTDQVDKYKVIFFYLILKFYVLFLKKKAKEKSDYQIQKVKDQVSVEEFRDEMKEEQRKLAYKRLVKGVDYEEPVRNAPFDIDDDYINIMTKEEREKLDERLLHEKMRSLSPGTLWKIEEER
jgi:hypothetical protein